MLFRLSIKSAMIYSTLKASKASIISNFSKSTNVFELKINFKKTEVIHQSPSGPYDIGQDIQIDGQMLIKVNKF